MKESNLPKITTAKVEATRPEEKRREGNIRQVMRQKLLNGLVSVFELLNPDTEIDKITKKLETSRNTVDDLSKEAGSFFRGLIPKGIRKETQEAPSHGVQNKILDERERIIRMQEIPKLREKKLSRQGYRNASQGILEEQGSVFRKNRIPYEGTIIENPGDPKRFLGFENLPIVQEVQRAVLQDGGQNLIYEYVENVRYADGKRSEARSDLIVQDIERGLSLNLNELLPFDYTFAPNVLSTIPSATHKDNAQKKIADLKDYTGPTGEKGNFVAELDEMISRVEYGNLTQKGRLLAVLHEVAHSWQKSWKNMGEGGGHAFEMQHGQIVKLVSELLDARLESLRSVGTFETETCREKMVYMESELLKIGVVLHDNKIFVNFPIREEGILNIPFGSNFIPVKSKSLQDAMEVFVAEERDAWAHALKTLRFLRSKGLDLEPQLETLADIKAKIDPCLRSYDEYSSYLMAIQDGDRRFASLQ